RAAEQAAQRARRLLARRSGAARQDLLLHDLRAPELRDRQPGAVDDAVGSVSGGGDAAAAAERGAGEFRVAIVARRAMAGRHTKRRGNVEQLLQPGAADRI